MNNSPFDSFPTNATVDFSYMHESVNTCVATELLPRLATPTDSSSVHSMNLSSINCFAVPDTNSSRFYKIIFWNLHGFVNLPNLTGQDFLEYIDDCAALCFSESWLREKIQQLHGMLAKFEIFEITGKKNWTTGRASGGLGVLYDPKVLKSPRLLDSCDSHVAIKCEVGDMNLVLVSVYINSKKFASDIERLASFLMKTLENFSGVLLVGGDFNSRIGDTNQLPPDVFYDTNFSGSRAATDLTLNAQGRLLVREMENLGLFVLNGRSSSDQVGGLTFFSENGSSTIDFVWTNHAGLSFLSDFSVLNMGLSDHLPVAITTNITTPVTSNSTGPSVVSRKLIWDESKRREYCNQLLGMDAPSLDHQQDVNVLNEILTENLENAARAIGMERSFNTKISSSLTREKPWYSKECAELRRTKNNSYRVWLKSQSTDAKSNFLRARNDFKSMCRKAKNEYDAQIKQYLANVKNPNQFWSTVNKLKGKKKSVCPIPCEELERFYEDIYPARSFLKNDFYDVRHPFLDADFTFSEVLKILHSLKNGKSPGPDGISNSFYKWLPPEWIGYLTSVFNKVFREGIVPEDWCCSEVFLLYKKGNPLDPLNYRGISLSNSVTKIFTALISARLTSWCEQCNVLPELQGGFRSSRSCEDNVFTLHARVAVELSKPKGKLYAAFIDFRRAFVSVSHSLLWDSLYKTGVSGKIIRVLQNLYQRAGMKIKLDANSRSKRIDVTEGVLQGDTLSPVLFIIFISDILDFFQREGHLNVERDVDMLLFADDLTLLARDGVDLQSKLFTLEKYCARINLVVNTEKSEILLFKKSGRFKRERVFKYGREPLRTVKRYTYLGITFSSSGTFNFELDRALSKGKSALGTIWHVLCNGNTLNWDAARKLFDSVVCSTVLYSAGVWGLKHVDEIEQIQTVFLKRLLSLPTCTPGYMLRLESGSTHLDSVVVKRSLNYWLKILEMHPDRYPRRMYNKLKDLDHLSPQPNNRNWVSQLRIALDKSGHEYLLNHENASAIRLALPIIDGVMKKRSFTRDVERATSSSYCPHYHRVKDLSSIIREPYLTLPLPIGFIRTFASCRLSSYFRLSFKIKDTLYKINALDFCTLCNVNEKEDLPHLLTSCPMYDYLRTRFLGNRSLLDILRSQDKDEIANLMFYMSAALRRRSMVLCEYDD